jgi:hypothetical protein
VAPGELFAGLDGAVLAQLGLEGAGLAGGVEEQIAAGDAFLQGWGRVVSSSLSR